MTNGEKMLVSIAIEAAKSCLRVFENEYPADDRPRKALDAAEKWFHEPTMENCRLLANLETQIWNIKGLGPWASCIRRASMRMRGQGCPTSRYLGNGCNLV